MFVVTRQKPYYQGGQLIVEVASGGMDYAGSDALTKKYDGEFREFADPREAVETAVEIVKQWRKDSGLPANSRKILIGTGSTGGGMCEIEGESFKAAREWARKLYAKLDKCPVCGRLMPEKRKRYHLIDDPDETEFCSEVCAEREQEWQAEQEEANA
jgi:hypothetical protein